MRNKLVATAPIALAALLLATLGVASSSRRVYINCFRPSSSVRHPAGHTYYTRAGVTPTAPGARTGTLLVTPACQTVLACS